MKTCRQCQCSFLPNPKAFRPQIYCNKKCARLAYLLRHNPNYRPARPQQATHCEWCGTGFTPKPTVMKRQIFCRAKCAVSAGGARRRDARRALMNLQPKACAMCHRTFMPRVKAQKLCDASCQGAWNLNMALEYRLKYVIPTRQQQVRQCDWCGDDFKPERTVTRHCGRQCRKEELKYLKEENGE
jgi:hypothetical protein